MSSLPAAYTRDTGASATAAAASRPAGRAIPQPVPLWGQPYLDYAPLEGDTRHPCGEVERAAARDSDPWIPGVPMRKRSSLRSELDKCLGGTDTWQQGVVPWRTSS